VVPGARQRITVELSGLPAGDTDWELAVTVRAATTEARLLEAFAGRPRGSVIAVRTFPVGPERRQTIDLPVGACETCVPVRRAGVHPVVVELRRPGGDTVADTFPLALTVVDPDRPPAGAPVPLALVVRLHQPPGVAADGSDAAVDLRRFVEATEALARHPGVPLTVVATPETLESIDRQGGGGGVLDTLRSALEGRTLVADGYVRWRPGVLESAAVGDELRRQTDRGTAVMERLGFPAVNDVAVLDDGPIPSSGALERAGLTQLVVPADTVERPEGTEGRPLVVDVGAADRVDAPALPAIVTDPVLRAALAPPGRERETVLAANHLTAILAVRRAASPPGDADRPALAVVLPETFSPGLDTVLTALGALARPRGDTVGVGGLVPVTVDALLAAPGEPVIATPVSGARPELTRSEADEVVGFRRQIDGVAALTGDAAEVDTLERRLGVTLADDLPGGPQPHRDALRAALRRDLFVVDLLPGGSYRLTARQGSVPVTIRTTVTGPVTVRIQASSDRLEFPGYQVVPGVGAGTIAFRDVVLTEPSTTVLVPVSARTSGSFRFQVTVATPSSEEVALSTTSYTVRSTAVSGVGVALSIASGLVLAAWWIRHLRRDRRDARLQAGARHPAAVPPESPSPPPQPPSPPPPGEGRP
jgi:hypothetical protein